MMWAETGPIIGTAGLIMERKSITVRFKGEF